MSSSAAGPNRPPPPRPEVTLAVLREEADGRFLDMSVARLLDDADLFVLNISRDPSGSWSAAVNVTAVEGTRIRLMSRQRASVTLGPTGCHELQVHEGDSLLVCQQHRERGRSAQALVTILRASR